MSSSLSCDSGRRRILVLGGGVYQAPLVRRARKMGLETIVVSPSGPYPGIALAHQHWDMDTTDAERVVASARTAKIAGVVTTGTDVCLPVLGRLVDELKLCGPSETATRLSTDKTLMKKAFSDSGIPTARFKIATSFADALRAANEIGYPVMIKASDSSGSRGVTRVASTAGCKRAWESAYAVSRNKNILVEEYLEGEEFGAQAFVTGGRITGIFAHTDTVTPAPFQTPVGHAMPMFLSPQMKNELDEIVFRAISALGIRNAVCNLDLVHTKNQVKVIEVGPRMGATCLPELVAVSAGFDVYEYLIRLALGEAPDIAAVSTVAAAALLLRSSVSGIVREVHMPERVAAHPALIEARLDVVAGDRVRKFQVGPDRVGHLVVRAENARSAQKLCEEMAKQIILRVESSAGTI